MLTSFMAFVVRYLVLGLAAAAVFVAESSATAHAHDPPPTTSGTVAVTGDVRYPTMVSVDEIRALAARRPDRFLRVERGFAKPHVRRGRADRRCDAHSSER